MDFSVSTHSVFGCHSSDTKQAAFPVEMNDIPFKIWDEPLSNRMHMNGAQTRIGDGNRSQDDGDVSAVFSNSVSPAALTLVYTAQLSHTLDQAVDAIYDQLVNLQEFTMAVLQSSSAMEARALQAEVNRSLEHIDRICAQTQFNGVAVLAGEVRLRSASVESTDIPFLTLRKIDVAGLNLQNYNIAGPKTATYSPSYLSPRDSVSLGSSQEGLRRDSPEDNARLACSARKVGVSLTLDGVRRLGQLEQDGRQNLYIKLEDSDADGRPSGPTKYYPVNTSELDYCKSLDPAKPELSLVSPIFSSELAPSISYFLRTAPQAGEYLHRVSANNLYVNGIKVRDASITMHSTAPIRIVVDGKLTEGLLLGSFNDGEKLYIGIEPSAGDPTAECKFYPVSHSDYSISYDEDEWAFIPNSKSNGVAHFSISSAQLHSEVQSAHLDVLQSAVAQLTAFCEELNKLTPAAEAGK